MRPPPEDPRVLSFSLSVSAVPRLSVARSLPGWGGQSSLHKTKKKKTVHFTPKDWGDLGRHRPPPLQVTVARWVGAGRRLRGQVLAKGEGARRASGTLSTFLAYSRGALSAPQDLRLLGWSRLEGQGARWRRGSFPAGWVGAVTTWLRLFFPLHFFFPSRFYLEAAPGRPRRNVTHQPARWGFGPKGRSCAPRRPLPCAPRALLQG